MTARRINAEAGSGNVFADLGLPDADTHYLKAQIFSEICQLTNERNLTQTEAGKLMGISQPEVSRMFKGRFREYSVARLMGFLTGFDRDVEIVMKPHRESGVGRRITFRIPVRSQAQLWVINGSAVSTMSWPQNLQLPRSLGVGRCRRPGPISMFR